MPTMNNDNASACQKSDNPTTTTKENERLGGKGSQKSVNHKTDTQKEIAKLAGVSHDTIHRVETIEASGFSRK